MPLDPLTIISAIVAIFVIWKLRSVLGERTGLEKPPIQPFVDHREAAPEPQRGAPASDVVRLPGAAQPTGPDPERWRGFADLGSPIAAGLDAISGADKTFSPGPFLDGAKIAYESVVSAFAAGDRKTLESLLAPDVYASFSHAIEERAKRNETLSTTFVSIDSAVLESAALEGRDARVGVRFTSKQISATHSADGTLTEGSPDRVADIDDIWTFARDVTSRDPNWKLVATQSGH